MLPVNVVFKSAMTSMITCIGCITISVQLTSLTMFATKLVEKYSFPMGFGLFISWPIRRLAISYTLPDAGNRVKLDLHGVL